MSLGDVTYQQASTGGSIVAVVPDIFFSVTVRNTIRRLGYDPRIVKSADDLADEAAAGEPVLAVVDVSAVRTQADWDTVSDVVRHGLPVLVFGAHKDVDGLRAAKAAGVTRVVSNGQFHREMPDLIQRYALPPACHVQPTGDDDDDSELGAIPPGMTVHHLPDGDVVSAADT